MTENDLITRFKRARVASTPLMAINCFDPEATMALLQASYKDGKCPPMAQWDIIRGLQHRNEAGEEAIKKALEVGGFNQGETMNPVGCLEAIMHMPERSIVFVANGHLHLEKDGKAQAQYVQALWNLRDPYKFDNRCVVLLGPQVKMPIELQQDMLSLDEKLPSDEQLRKVITDLAEQNSVSMSLIDADAAVDALRGLSAFPAEQAVAMGMSREGLDIGVLWDRKRQLIRETPGLSVWNEGQKFKDLGGLDEIKRRFSRVIAGKKPPRVIVWLDEIEKAMAGSGNDTSGTSQDQLSVLLSEMQDKDYSGAMLVGVPGAAKSAFAKAIGNEADVLTVKLDLGEMKGQYVGLSEERIRMAMKVVEAVGGHGGAMFIATSNDIRAVKPELKRRFRKGIYFFDLPDKQERGRIWDIYINKVGLDVDATDIPEDEGWTGAEIESCVQMAWEEGISLREAAKSVIPVSTSAHAEVERLRDEAHGRYSSTNHPGAYTRPAKVKDPVKMLNGKRVFNLSEDI